MLAYAREQCRTVIVHWEHQCSALPHFFQYNFVFSNCKLLLQHISPESRRLNPIALDYITLYEPIMFCPHYAAYSLPIVETTPKYDHCLITAKRSNRTRFALANSHAFSASIHPRDCDTARYLQASQLTHCGDPEM